MTTTDQFGGFSPPPPPAPAPPTRVLRRSRTDRVGAGVAGGLGEYFNVDPVLFRVLFATASFFGGAGVLAYLVAWAAIPERGAVNAPVDRFITELRVRRVPVWLVASVAALVLWGVAFSWWAPGHFFWVIVLVIIFVAIFGRKGLTGHVTIGPVPAGPPEPGTTPTVDLSKEGAAAPDPVSSSPTWVGETRQWIHEAKTASRLRRRRALPVRLATLGTLAFTLIILALVDATSGVALPVYFWAILGITAVGLLVGIVLRRTPWTVTSLLIPAVLGLVAFAGSTARLHDGFGARSWTPTNAAAIDSQYRLAFGRATLDLRHVGTLDTPRTIHLTLGAGEAELFVPSTMNVTVQGNVHIGTVQLNGTDLGTHHDGFNLNRTILPADSASGPALTIDIHVADGQITVNRGD